MLLQTWMMSLKEAGDDFNNVDKHEDFIAEMPLTLIERIVEDYCDSIQNFDLKSYTNFDEDPDCNYIAQVKQ